MAALNDAVNEKVRALIGDLMIQALTNAVLIEQLRERIAELEKLTAPTATE